MGFRIVRNGLWFTGTLESPGYIPRGPYPWSAEQSEGTVFDRDLHPSEMGRIAKTAQHSAYPLVKVPVGAPLEQVK